MNTCKNDDDMYVELVELNWRQADMFLNKAESIIASEIPPARLAENPTHFKCQYCTMKGVCHDNKPPLMNCRSCRFAKPVLNDSSLPGAWLCSNYNSIIPKDYLSKGCESYQRII
jgi:hypothetical protein